MICQHVDLTWHMEPCWPQQIMVFKSVSNTFLPEAFPPDPKCVSFDQMDSQETQQSDQGPQLGGTQWLCTFPLEIHITQFFNIGKVRVWQSKNSVIWALFHDSSSSIFPTHAIKHWITCYWAGPSAEPACTRKKGTWERKGTYFKMTRFPAHAYLHLSNFNVCILSYPYAFS